MSVPVRLRQRPEFVLLPLGILLLGTGLLLGRWGSLRSSLDLHPGETVGHLPEGTTLPFQIRLDAMAVDAPEAPPRLLLRRGDEEVAIAPEEGSTAAMGRTRLTVTKALAQATPEFSFSERSQGPANPVAHLLLGLGTPTPLEGYLVAKDKERRRFDEPGGRFAVLLLESWDEGQAATMKVRPGLLTFSIGGREFTHPAAPGTWAFPTFDFRIIDVFPDLGVGQGKGGVPEAFHRSRLPRNPWTLLRLTQKGGQAADLLIAANPPADPAYKASLAASLPPGADLRYDRRDEELVSRFVVLTPDGTVRLVEEGRVLRTEPLALGQPFVVAKGLSVTVLERLARAEMAATYHPAAPGAPGTPALQVQIEDPSRGFKESRWVGLERAEVEVPGTALRMRFGPPAPAKENVRARVAVLDAGASPILQRTLTGEETLEVKGHVLALGRGASQTGRWARINVSRDPWGPLRITGILLLGLGAVLLIRRRGFSVTSAEA